MRRSKTNGQDSVGSVEACEQCLGMRCKAVGTDEVKMHKGMGGLLSRVWKALFALDEFKMCVVGLDNAGKTTILYKYHLGEVVSTRPTIGSNVETVRHKNVTMQVWDLGGQDQMRSTWEAYFAQTNVLAFVVDSTDVERMPLCRSELERCLALPALHGCHVLILANKQDCSSAMDAASISTALNLVSFKTHNWHIQDCCALSGDGLDEALEWATVQCTH